MLLQSHSEFNVLGSLDISSGKLAISFRTEHPESSFACISGTFGSVGKMQICVYRDNGIMYLQVAKQRIPLREVRAEIRQNGSSRTLLLWKENTLLWSSKYFAGPPFLTDDDPTAFAEEEDFDFAIFLANVCSSRSRQERMYRHT